MNLQQRLNLIESYFLHISWIKKAELYLLPLFIAIFLLYNFSPTVKIVSLVESKAKPLTINQYQFMKAMNEFLKQESITLLSLKERNGVYTFDIEGNLNSLLRFAFFCESYKSINIIQQLILKNGTNKTLKNMILEFKFETIEYQSSQKALFLKAINDLMNPFDNEVTQQSDMLYAIVGSEALIGQNWLKVGDFMGEFQVEKIGINRVFLRNKNAAIKQLELYDEPIK